MPSETDILAAQERLLNGLAELSLPLAERLQAACLAADDTDEMIRLGEAFTKVGRCLRMSIALALRLRRGEPAIAAHEDPDLEVERDEPAERAERLERLDDREDLYDRLPAGDLPTQIATVARALRSAAKVLPAAEAAAYEAQCEALVANADLPPPPDRPLQSSRWRGQASATALATAFTPARPRGPPHT